MGLRKTLTLVVVAVMALALGKIHEETDMTLSKLKGKNVLLCGASKGIGREMALLYAENGANVVGVSRTLPLLEALSAEVEEKGFPGKVIPVTADLGNMDEVAAMVATAKHAVGNFDIIVLNHIRPYFETFERTDLATFDNILDVNFRSFVHITSILLEDALASNASIIAVSSVAGKVGIPYTAIYSATKHAIHGLFDTIRLEAAMFHPQSSMTVTTCVIGAIDTESAVSQTKGKLKERSLASPVDTANAIIKAGLHGVRELYYPFLEAFPAVVLSHMLPSAVFDFFLKQQYEGMSA